MVNDVTQKHFVHEYCLAASKQFKLGFYQINIVLFITVRERTKGADELRKVDEFGPNCADHRTHDGPQHLVYIDNRLDTTEISTQSTLSPPRN